MTPVLSENGVVLVDDDGKIPDGFSGPRFTLAWVSPAGSHEDVLSAEIIACHRLSAQNTPQRPNGPHRIVHAVSHWEFSLIGEELDADQSSESATPFITRTPMSLLVELENPRKQLFTHNGAQAAGLTQAIDQLLNWYRYIEENIETVRRELGLEGITPNPRGLVVIGRSERLTSQNRRKLTTMRDRFDFEVITYDDLRTGFVQSVEHIVGPLRKESGNTTVYFPLDRE